jgi:hypothetical protein
MTAQSFRGTDRIGARIRGASMKLDSGKQRMRRGLSFLAMAVVLGLSAVGLTQCRLLDNSVTGVDLKTAGRFGGAEQGCVKTCNEDFKECKKAEAELHKQAMKDCNALPRDERDACKQAESVRHQDANKACSERKQACKQACNYREGSGSGGQ